MRIRHALFAAATAAALAVAAATPASAADSPFTPQKLALETTTVTTVTNPECVEAVNAAIADGATDLTLDVCTRTSKLTVTPATRVTHADLLAAKDSLSPAEYSELAAAVINGAVQKKAFRQEQINVSDMVVQFGTFYHDGERVWISTTYRGVRGSHKCEEVYAVGLDPELVSCSDSGGTSERTIFAKWRFSVIHKVIPVSWTETYSLKVNSAGRIWQ